MVHMFARGMVEDYATFRKVFDGAEEMRRAAGATGNSVYQNVHDPNEITVRVEFPSEEAAMDFWNSTGLREAMKRSGLQGPPTMWLVNET